MFRVSLVASALLLAGTTWAVPDFTILHMSDSHVPFALAQTKETVKALPVGKEIALAPFGITVPAPGLAIVTGDLNEYGGGAGAWEQYQSLWRDLGIPVYSQLGNHDNTWDCSRPRLRKIQGSVYYAFEYSGAKFVGWDTASAQDPRPSVSAEGLNWLRSEFERTPAEQPVFLFCHHPLGGSEFSSAYDSARLLEVLQTRNVVLMLVGHGHGARAMRIAGFDAVMGGNTYSDTRGYGIISVKDNVIRVCHQFLNGEQKLTKLLEKPLPQRSPFLAVTSAPDDGKVFGTEDPLTWEATVGAPGAASARCLLDGELKGSITGGPERWTVQLDREGLSPGAHVLRMEFTDAGGIVTTHSVAFRLQGGPVQIAWRQQLLGSCQSTPLALDGRLYVGSNDGAISCLEASSGKSLWRMTTGGEVRSGIVSLGDGRVCFASADGQLRAVTPEGKFAWTYDAGSPMYSTPVVQGNTVACGTNGGEVVALDRQTGQLLWRTKAADYTIETPGAVGPEAFYFGAWDRYVHALSLTDGKLLWSGLSKGAEKETGSARYYSPADCGPVYCQEKVFVADRAYKLSILDAKTGQLLASEDKCAAVGAAADGQSVYVRHSDGRVSKRGPEGNVLWVAEAPTGYVPTPPVEAAGKVYVISGAGTLTVLDAATGAVRSQYKVSPGLYVFAAPACDGQQVYVADMGGNLLALSTDGF